jgi:hypothetical protein
MASRACDYLNTRTSNNTLAHVSIFGSHPFDFGAEFGIEIMKDSETRSDNSILVSKEFKLTPRSSRKERYLVQKREIIGRSGTVVRSVRILPQLHDKNFDRETNSSHSVTANLLSPSDISSKPDKRSKKFLYEHGVIPPLYLVGFK